MLTADLPEIATVRGAVDADGPSIGRLAEACKIVIEGCDWSRVQPYWIVAEQEGVLVGAVQMCPSLPIAGLEHLCLSPSLRRIEKGLLVKQLLYAACGAMAQMGATYVRGMIPYHLGSYMEVLAHHGAVEVTQGAMFLKRIR